MADKMMKLLQISEKKILVNQIINDYSIDIQMIT